MSSSSKIDMSISEVFEHIGHANSLTPDEALAYLTLLSDGLLWSRADSWAYETMIYEFRIGTCRVQLRKEPHYHRAYWA